MDGCDTCLDAAKAVVIDVKGVVALVISMVARCARSRALEEVVGLCEVRLQFWPRHVVLIEGVPFQNGNLVQARFGDGRDCLIHHLFHGEWWF